MPVLVETGVLGSVEDFKRVVVWWNKAFLLDAFADECERTSCKLLAYKYLARTGQLRWRILNPLVEPLYVAQVECL